MSKLVTAMISVIVLIAVIFLVAQLGSNAVRQQAEMTHQISQDMAQLDVSSTNMLNLCVTAISMGDLQNCKTFILDLQNKCLDPQYSSMSTCKDARIVPFLSTVDSKIAYAKNIVTTSGNKLNNDYLKMIDMCYQAVDVNTLSTCQTEMLQMQQQCDSFPTNTIPACNDPRIVQILNQQVTAPSNVYDYASQSMESFINLCSMTRDNNVIQDCTTKAKQMIVLCQSTNIQACNDPRLQQMANVGQTTESSSLNNSSQTTVNATALNSLNSEMQQGLDACASGTISAAGCAKVLNLIKQDCAETLETTNPSYFPACNDPRLH